MASEGNPGKGLFRSEVLEAKQAQWLGATRIAAPVSHTVWTAAALLIAVVIVAFLFLGEYTRRVRVAGTIVPTSGLITLKSRTEGVVTAIGTKEGMPARKGSHLVTISGERFSESFGGTSGEISKQLRERLLRLQADAEDREALGHAKAQGLRQQKTRLVEQARQVAAQIEHQAREREIQGELLSRMRSLGDRRYVSVVDERRQEVAVLSSESAYSTLLRQQSELRQQIGGIEAQLSQVEPETRIQVSEINQNLGEASRLLAQSETERLSVMTAPADGLVTSLLIKPGQSVVVGQPLLSLVPKNSVLQAQLFVSSDAIGFIKVGGPVALQYKAFPYQKFGLHRGRVASISRNAIAPSEAAALLGGSPSDQSYYRVNVSIDTPKITAYGRRESLLPGMELEADVMLDRRPVFEWVFEPLYGMGRRLQFSGA